MYLYLFQKATVFILVEIPLDITFDSEPTLGSTNAVESGGLYDELILKADYINLSRNLFNIDTDVITPQNIQNSGQIVTGNVGWGMSKFYPCVAGDKINLSGNFGREAIAFYSTDASNGSGYISGSINLNAVGQHIAPTGSLFYAFNLFSSSNPTYSDIMLNLGDDAIPYEPYYLLQVEKEKVEQYAELAGDNESMVNSDKYFKGKTIQNEIDRVELKVEELGSSELFKVNQYAPNLVHLNYDDTLISRKTVINTVYDGSTFYVSTTGNDSNDGLTESTAKLTITNAYSIASNLDVIQLMDGTYDLTSESGGYLLFNDNSKGVMIKGNSDDKSFVTLNHSSNGFSVRFRDCGYQKFKDLTLNLSGSGIKIYTDGKPAYNNKKTQFENCQINVSGTGIMYNYVNVGEISGTRYDIDFIKCDLDLSTTGKTLSIGSADTGFEVMFSECSFIRSNESGLKFGETLANCYVYNCDFNMQDIQYGIIFGTDTAEPTQNYGLLDIRENKISYGTGYYQHAILVGRGVKNAFVINNKVEMDSVNNGIALGFVIKSIPDNLGDVKIYGNYSKSPRPFYIKGGINNDVRYNSFISNNSNYSPFEFVNFAGSSDILSINNQVKNNTFVSLGDGIGVYPAGTTIESDVSIQNNIIEDNRYYIVNNYLKNYVNALTYTWVNRQNFWSTDKDVDSALLYDFHLPIRLIN